MSPKSVTISLDDKRRKVSAWWQKLQHVIGGVPLLSAGVRRLEAPGATGHTLAVVEIVIATRPGSKPLFHHALLYVGLTTIFTGLAHGMFANRAWKRRFIRVDDGGVHARLSRFRKFDVEWNDVIDIRLGERDAIIVTKDGSHTIRLNRYLNARNITTALADWRERHALARTP